MLDDLRCGLSAARQREDYAIYCGRTLPDGIDTFFLKYGSDLIAAVKKAQRCKCQGWPPQKGWTSGDNFRTDEEKQDAS